EAVMVGDTIEDDVEGARAVGMQAVLLDREGRYADYAGRLDDLRELPVVLGPHRWYKTPGLQAAATAAASPSVASPASAQRIRRAVRARGRRVRRAPFRRPRLADP